MPPLHRCSRLFATTVAVVLVLLGAPAMGQPRYSFRRRPPARNLSAAVPVTMDDARALAGIRSHAFVFVGGVPQSGTSLARSIVAASSLVSGQDSCLATTRCFENNVEGQWLLDRRRPDMEAVLRVYYGVDVLQKLSGPKLLTARNATSTLAGAGAAGAVLPATANHRQPHAAHAAGAPGPRLFANWARYWNLSKPVLLEKSPPNLLKMGYLREAFRGARAVRFLVVLKDPVTNNLFYRPRRPREALLERAAARLRLLRATATGAASSSSSSSSSSKAAQGAIFPDTVIAQLNFLDEWLVAHELVLKGLGQWGRDGSLDHHHHQQQHYDSHSQGQEAVRFLRYESIAGGVPCDLCRRLFQFLLQPAAAATSTTTAIPLTSPSPCARVSRRCTNSNHGNFAFAAAATPEEKNQQQQNQWHRRGEGGGGRSLLAMIDESQARARRSQRGGSQSVGGGSGSFRNYDYTATRKRRRDRWRDEVRVFTPAQRRAVAPFAPRLKAFGYALYDDAIQNQRVAIAPYLI
jgi:hypothetical protein